MKDLNQISALLLARYPNNYPVMATAIIWLTALTSFDDADIGLGYFNYVAKTTFPTVNFTGFTSLDGAIDGSKLHEWRLDLDEDEMITFLDHTNNFDLDTIAMLLQPSISSKISYYILSGVYYNYFGDSDSTLESLHDFIIVTDS